MVVLSADGESVLDPDGESVFDGIAVRLIGFIAL
jgi:hypothetical protein